MNEIIALNTLALQGLKTMFASLGKTLNNFNYTLGKTFNSLSRSLGSLLKAVGVLALSMGLIGLIINKLISSIDTKMFNTSRNLGVNAPDIKTRQLALENSGVQIDVVKMIGEIKEAMIDPAKRMPFAQIGLTDLREKSNPMEIFDELIQKLGSGDVNKTLALRSLNELGMGIETAGRLLDSSFNAEYQDNLRSANKTMQLKQKEYVASQKFTVQLNLLGEKVSNVVAKLGLKIIPYVSNMVNQFDKLLTNSNIDSLVQSFGSGLSSFAKWISSFSSNSKESGNGIKALKITWEVLSSIFNLLANTLITTIDFLNLFWLSLKSVFLQTNQLLMSINPFSDTKKEEENKIELKKNREDMARTVSNIANNVLNNASTTSKTVNNIVNIVNNQGVSDARLKQNNAMQLNGAR